MFERKTEGIKCVKLSVNWKDSGAHWVPLRLTCTLWGSPVILRGLSAPVGMGSSWIIIICTPVLSCRGTISQKQKQELPGAQKTTHSKRWKFCQVSKSRFYFDLRWTGRSCKTQLKNNLCRLRPFTICKKKKSTLHRTSLQRIISTSSFCKKGKYT